MIGSIIKFHRDTRGSVPQIIDGIHQSWVLFPVKAGSVGIVICNAENDYGIDKYSYDILVDNRIVRDIRHGALVDNCTALYEGECS